jgi:hypothetical protein
MAIDHSKSYAQREAELRATSPELFNPVIVEDCSGCPPRGGPTHNGSARCQSYSIASGGHRSHCSCDVCF